MSAEPIPHHTCNYYCANGRHAIPCIATPGINIEMLQHRTEFDCNMYGWTIVSFQKCEADAEQWGMTHQLSSDNGRLSETYVVIIEEMEE